MVWLRNVVKYRKYTLAKFAIFLCIKSITRGKACHLPPFSTQMWQARPRVIQIYLNFRNFARLYFSYFTTFRKQTNI